MCRYFGGFLTVVSNLFEVLANLLTAWAGRVEIFLRVALNLWGAAPPTFNFISKLAQTVGQFGLVNGRGELL